VTNITLIDLYIQTLYRISDHHLI